MYGKPRKFGTLLKRSRQVARLLSQPAVTLNVSPSAMSNGMVSQSSNETSAPLLTWNLTSMIAPALAPATQVTFPPVNQPSWYPPSPLDENVWLVAIPSTVPLPL